MSDHLFTAVAGDPDEALVDIFDIGIKVGDHDRMGALLHCQRQFAQLVFRLLAPGFKAKIVQCKADVSGHLDQQLHLFVIERIRFGGIERKYAKRPPLQQQRKHRHGTVAEAQCRIAPGCRALITGDVVADRRLALGQRLRG